MCRKEGRSFVFKLFDISKHLRGSGTVDKIKKYRRDNSRECSLTLAVSKLPQPSGSVIHSRPRKTLLVFHIIIPQA